MPSQAQSWSNAAEKYDEDFIDPYTADTRNPLLPELEALVQSGVKTIADLGCGRGPLLPFLCENFEKVYAVDFAEGMLKHAKESTRSFANVEFMQQKLTDLSNLRGRLDAAAAVNSIVMPNIVDQETTLRQIFAALRPGGTFLSILPAMDSVHYHTMLLVDRALESGKPLSAARSSAAHFGDHVHYDFAFGQFRYKGLEQHFWQPFEIRHRFRKAGFRKLRMKRVLLSWEQVAGGEELKQHSPPWDWFVRAERPR